MLSFAAHQAASWRQRGVALPPCRRGLTRAPLASLEPSLARPRAPAPSSHFFPFELRWRPPTRPRLSIVRYVAPRLLYEHACRRLWRAERAAAWPRARLSVHALLFHELLLASGALLVRACAEGLPAHSAAQQLWEREAEEREAAALARRAPPYRGSEHDLKSPY